jgi:hypothetical protein
MTYGVHPSTPEPARPLHRRCFDDIPMAFEFLGQTGIGDILRDFDTVENLGWNLGWRRVI